MCAQSRHVMSGSHVMCAHVRGRGRLTLRLCESVSRWCTAMSPRLLNDAANDSKYSRRFREGRRDSDVVERLTCGSMKGAKGM